jgi:hypothetical protein
MRTSINRTPTKHVIAMLAEFGPKICDYMIDLKEEPLADSCIFYGRTLEIDTLQPEGRTLDQVIKWFANHDIDILEYSMTLEMYQDEDDNFHNHITLTINTYDS